jgi:L-iditol 2-dehydrogenase
VESYKIGDRMIVSHHVPCNTCCYCLSDHQTACETLHTTNYYPGGFAEYLRVPELNVDRGIYLLPDEVSYEEGTFIEPLACVLRGQRLAGIEAGNTVLVMGSGISGILHIQLARLFGAARIIATDISKYRIDAARRFGADIVFDAAEDLPEKLREVNEGRLADKVVVCAGSLSAAKQALQCVDRGGTVLFFAVPEPGIDLPVPLNDLWRNEMTIMTSYGAAPADLATALGLIRAKRINAQDMITHRLSLTETGRGFQLVAQGKESLKVIIEPWR